MDGFVVVIVSPLAGLLADSVGFGQTCGSAVVIFAASAMLLALSPRARVT
jgi:hypothetical protein